MKHLWFLVISLASACGSSAPGSPDAAPDAPPPCTPSAGAAVESVTTTSGVLRGARDGQTWAYKRVPFAAPPVGAQRLRAPAPAACSTAPVDATAMGPVCPQPSEGGVVGDEDCLQLNLWAPAAPAAPRPVMVWIHGGANTIGSGTYPYYDGRRLAEAGDVLVVTTNYRLGQLGYLALPELGAEAADHSEGNYGLLDQIAALRWVHDNIAAFGGDPGNVMVFGESAGGRNVCSLIAAPQAAGLFHKALIESGACKFLPTKAVAEGRGADVVAAVGCAGAADVPACLRALPAAALIQAIPGDPGILGTNLYNPTVDGVVQLDQPEATIRAGRHNRVALAIGANADETGKQAPAIADEAAYEQLVRSMYPASIADRVLAQYPASAYPTPRAAFVRATTDSRFVCPSREIAAGADAAQTEPVYRYLFQYRLNALGAVHGLEVPFVFGTFNSIEATGQSYVPTPADLALSSAIQGLWTRFARTGTPGGTPAWPSYDATDPALVLDATLTTATGIRKADCDFWKPYYQAL